MFGKKGKKESSLDNAGGVSFSDPKTEEAASGAVADSGASDDVAFVVDDPLPSLDGTDEDPKAGEEGPVAAAGVDTIEPSEPISTDALKASKRGKVKKEKPAKVKKVKTPKEGGFFSRFAKSGDPMAGGGKASGSSEEEPSLPMMVIIDYYRGMTKEREAEQLIRATIEKNFDAPNASYFYIQKFRDGLAVEMQEGGGRAYLPEILAKIEEDPHAVCAAPMSNRVAQVRLDPDTKSLETLILQANQMPSEGVFTALPTLPMRPFDRRGSRVFLAGIGLLAASTIGLMFSVGAFFIDTEAWAIPYVAQTPVKDLPMAQVSQIESALSSGADCIYKMEYAGGSWTITPGYDNGGVCGMSPALPVVEGEGLTDGEVVTLDGAAGPPVDGSAPPPPETPAIFGPPAGAPAN